MDITLNHCDFLDSAQEQMLIDYANGLDANAIADHLGYSTVELRMLELDTRAAMGAKTTPHMISRAWQLGILSTKCLCLVLACLSAQLSDDALRLNRNTRIKSQTSIARINTGNTGRNQNV